MREPEYFARFVLEATSRMERVVCYEQGGPHPSLTWPEMGDPDWRDACLVAMNKQHVREAKFVEPTAEADWKFTAKRRHQPH